MSDSTALDLGRLMEKVSNLAEETKGQGQALKEMSSFLTGKLDEQTSFLRDRSDTGFTTLREQMHTMTAAFVSRNEWLERMDQWRTDFNGAASGIRTELALVRSMSEANSTAIAAMKTREEQRKEDRAPSTAAWWTVIATVSAQLVGSGILGLIGYFMFKH